MDPRAGHKNARSWGLGGSMDDIVTQLFGVSCRLSLQRPLVSIIDLTF